MRRQVGAVEYESEPLGTRTEGWIGVSVIAPSHIELAVACKEDGDADAFLTTSQCRELILLLQKAVAELEEQAG